MSRCFDFLCFWSSSYVDVDLVRLKSKRNACITTPLLFIHFIFIYFFAYYRDADDTKAWISEKDTALSTSDYGRDLASVQALQRKHEVLERDLAALEEKVW